MTLDTYHVPYPNVRKRTCVQSFGDHSGRIALELLSATTSPNMACLRPGSLYDVDRVATVTAPAPVSFLGQTGAEERFAVVDGSKPSRMLNYTGLDGENESDSEGLSGRHVVPTFDQAADSTYNKFEFRRKHRMRHPQSE